MASRSSSRLLLACAAVLASVLLATTITAVRSPDYCVPGQAIPPRSNPLPHCGWYVASMSPSCTGRVAVPLLPLGFMKDMCCRQLASVPAECRCKALRAMMEEKEKRLMMPSSSAAATAEEDRQCWAEQAEWAASMVTEAQCGLSTIHGRPFCYTLGAEE